MYCISGDYQISTNLNSILQDCLEEFLPLIAQCKEEILLHAKEDLFDDKSNRGYIYQLTEGSFSWYRQDNLCLVVEEGDLIGIEEIFDYKVGRYKSDFAVRCNRYSYESIFKQSEPTSAVHQNGINFFVRVLLY
jgi:hypothetical protein